jgi:hypothetical protein
MLHDKEEIDKKNKLLHKVYHDLKEAIRDLTNTEEAHIYKDFVGLRDVIIASHVPCSVRCRAAWTSKPARRS